MVPGLFLVSFAGQLEFELVMTGISSPGLDLSCPDIIFFLCMYLNFILGLVININLNIT